jgi:hypothetical protein
MQQRQQPQPQVDLTKTTAIQCDSCGHNVFSPGLFLRKVSKFVSQDGRDGVLPVQTFHCVKCGHVNPDFYPPELIISGSNEQQ